MTAFAQLNQLRSLNTLNSLNRLAQHQHTPHTATANTTTTDANTLQALQVLSRLTPEQQNALLAAHQLQQQQQQQQHSHPSVAVTAPAAAAATPSTTTTTTTTHHQQQQQHRMLSDPEFLNTRSPFYETISRHCVMPICHKQRINFQFNLPRNYVHDVHAYLRTQQAQPPPPPSSAAALPPPRVLHIRLYDLEHKQHTEWKLGEFELRINDQTVHIPHSPADAAAAAVKDREKERKAKACRFIQPLDISQFAREAMNFELKCFKNQFYGAASIEIVNVLSVDQIAERVIARSKLAQRIHSMQSSQTQNVALTQTCQVCDRRDSLSRCSRCKAVWYCSREHQQQDWSKHGLGCMQREDLLRLRLYANNPQHATAEDEEEGVVCDQMIVSLRDPISLCKLATPARGTRCYHPSCVDLNTYLHYCRRYRVWQCPICAQPLRYRDLVVDESMRTILSELDDDIDQVRLNPDDYSYKVITAQEQREQDNRVRGASRNRNKKRKHSEITTLEDGELSNGVGGGGGDGDGCSQKKKKSKSNSETTQVQSTRTSVTPPQREIIVLD